MSADCLSDDESLDGALVIYTDGACSGNPGPGGWGVVMFHGSKQKELKGGDPDTTNNRMEMQAVIEALKAIKPSWSGKTVLFSDSTYVLKGLQEWMPGWKKRGWKTAAKKPVKNVDLWKELDELAAARKIDWRWVKGHAGDFGNERADALASEGVPKAKRKSRKKAKS
ncbi:ribonuclease HI [Algimonas ampicilliniresistens]|uniref:Ribonuclease H n=1 Tax=Algimonas ampicilliniresistens TaxID=1298735 RepID=A0ABQ5VBZ4_9PROT|nr:ribonuclease HI [Algimonas ampicilliniresistens]GLQ25021.1 ribonuclease HI [Algimonas ampicilliniresistens]